MSKSVITAAIITGIAIITAAIVRIAPRHIEKKQRENRPPIIGEIVVNSRIIKTREEVTISVAAVDPDEDPLIYTWSAQKGEIPQESRNEATIIYTAPNISEKDVITVLVRDNRGGETKKNLIITVLADEAKQCSTTEAIQVIIESPRNEISSLEEPVSFFVTGMLIGDISERHLWEIFVLVHPLSAEGWWTMKPGVVVSKNWKVKIYLEGKGEYSVKDGEKFQVIAVVTKEPLNDKYSNLRDLPLQSYISEARTLTARRKLIMPAITIKKIISNAYILGNVSDLDPQEYNKYKVIVYVKTDKWYIHPYVSGGEGLNFASIKNDGSWQIHTVKRQWLASQVAVFIVKKDYSPPRTYNSIKEIDYIAQYIEDGKDRL